MVHGDTFPMGIGSGSGSQSSSGSADSSPPMRKVKDAIIHPSSYFDHEFDIAVLILEGCVCERACPCECTCFVYLSLSKLGDGRVWFDEFG